MKKYEDERINFLLEQLQEDIKLDNESSRIDVNSVLNQLYANIDKVVDYTKNGCKGDLFLKSNIWENCYYTLSQILGLYNLKLIGREIMDNNEVVFKVNDPKKEIFKSKLSNEIKDKNERSR